VGLETAALVGIGMTAGGQIYSGLQANDQARDAARMEQANATIAGWETQDAIASKTEETVRLKEAQKMAMLKSGMNLAGSNLLVLEDTKRQLSIAVGQLQQRQAISDLNSQYKQTSILKSGRAAMIGGFTNAAGTVGSYFLNGYKSKASTSSGVKTVSNGYPTLSGGTDFSGTMTA
jgi:hypothetical protein